MRTILCFLVVFLRPCVGSDAMTYNGGSLLAMAGKSCVAVVTDSRLGTANSLVSEGACRVLECGNRCVVAMRGLHADVQFLLEELDARLRLRWIQAGGEENGPRATLEPEALSALLSVLLYGTRLSTEEKTASYFLEPIVAGVTRKGETYLCAQDSLGAKLVADDYVVAGTAAHSLHGACEALYEPDLEPDELVEVATRCMVAGLNRDCLSGRTLAVYVVTPDGIANKSPSRLKTTPRRLSAGSSLSKSE